jgi:hypothetical protein
MVLDKLERMNASDGSKPCDEDECGKRSENPRGNALAKNPKGTKTFK